MAFSQSGEEDAHQSFPGINSTFHRTSFITLVSYTCERRYVYLPAILDGRVWFVRLSMTLLPDVIMTPDLLVGPRISLS